MTQAINSLRTHPPYRTAIVHAERSLGPAKRLTYSPASAQPPETSYLGQPRAVKEWWTASPIIRRSSKQHANGGGRSGHDTSQADAELPSARLDYSK